jgi:hypothetical protein
MNLAVLTGRQISKPLKIFIVSQAGEIADVTLNSLCTSKDQSVLKVFVNPLLSSQSFLRDLLTVFNSLKLVLSNIKQPFII